VRLFGCGHGGVVLVGGAGFGGEGFGLLSSRPAAPTSGLPATPAPTCTDAASRPRTTTVARSHRPRFATVLSEMHEVCQFRCAVTLTYEVTWLAWPGDGRSGGGEGGWRE